MQHHQDERDQHGSTMQVAVGVLAGILIGGLAGAGAMLLLAPQSGKQTREQIQRKALDLRDQATDTIEDAVTQAKDTGRHISDGVEKRVGKIQQRGQDILGEQKERWSAVVEAGQKAVKGTA